MKLKVIVTLFLTFITPLFTLIAAKPRVASKSSTVKKNNDRENSDISFIFRKINKPNYSTQTLAYDFSDMVSLLDFGKRTKKNSVYFERVFRLFNRFQKEAPCINGYAFKDLITHLDKTLHTLFSDSFTYIANVPSVHDNDMFDRFKSSVNSVMYNRFLTDYKEFKLDPETFLSTLSESIVDLAEQEVNMVELRSVIVRFLETGVAKLAWSPDDQDQIWDCLRSISNHLAKLEEHGIIYNRDDLDDIYLSLIYRFSVFLDAFGNSLSVDFYNTIYSDIENKKVSLVNLEEQQEWLIGKDQLLKNMILTHKAKMLASTNGIIVR